MSAARICARRFMQGEGLSIEPAEIGNGLSHVAGLEETNAGEPGGSRGDARCGVPHRYTAEREYGHAGTGGNLARANFLQFIYPEWHDVRSHFLKHRSEDRKVCAVGFRLRNLFCV